MEKATNAPKSMKCLVCAKCVGDDYLKSLIESSDSEDQCTYGHECSRVVDIENIVVCIKALFDRHFMRISNDIDEGDTVTVNEIIQQYARVSNDLADQIQIRLEEKYDSEESRKFFSKKEKYKLNMDSFNTRSKKWDDLQDIIRYKNRALNRKSREILDSVIGEILKNNSKNVVIEIGPKAEIYKKNRQLNVFRARNFESEISLMSALKSIDDEIGPPPPHKARPGRLNADGVSVIYCATNAEVAVAEVRPPVGSRVVVATFKINGKFKLLDIESLQRIANLSNDSKLDPEYMNKKEITMFLEEFCENISAPVVPSNEKTEYLVTQVIADYLSDFEIDGIMYSSSQRMVTDESSDEKVGKNIIIFNKSSKIEDRNVSKDKEHKDIRIKNRHKRSRYLVQELELGKSKENADCSNGSAATSPSLTLDEKNVYVHTVNEIEYIRSKTKVKFRKGNREDFLKRENS